MSEDLKNICFHKQRQLWFVKIQKQHRIFEAYTESKEEAIQLRDKVRKFVKEHGRPPEFDEVGHQPQKRKVEPKPKTVYIMTCAKCNRVTKKHEPNNFRRIREIWAYLRKMSNRYCSQTTLRARCSGRRSVFDA